MVEAIKYLKKKDDPDYYKKYYQKNKEKILEKNKEKVKCKCGQIITRYNIKTQKITNS